MKKKYIKDFYGSDIKQKFKQSSALFTIVAALLITSTAFEPNLPNFIVPQLTPSISKIQKSEVQTNSLLLREPIRYSNRPRVTVYSRSQSTNRNTENSSVAMGSILGASDDTIEIKTYSVYVPKRKTTYEYFIAKIDGIYQFSPSDIYGQYDNLKYDMDTHIVPHAIKVFAEELKAPFIYLGNYKGYELDHVLKLVFRNAFNISPGKKHVVVIPPTSKFNANWTNKQSEYEYSLFDIRVPGP